MYDRNRVAGAECWTSRSMRWSGESSSQQPWRQQYILDKNWHDNLGTTKNSDFEQVKTVFDISQSLILNHKRSLRSNGILLHEWDRLRYMTDQSNCRRQKVHVHSDSELRLGKTMNILFLHRSGKNKLDGSWILWTMEDLNGIDGEPVEFEWHIFAGHTTQCLLHGMRRKITWRFFKIESSPCRCAMTSIGRKVMNTPKCVFRTLRKSRLPHTDSPRDISLSSYREPKKSGMTQTYQPEGQWNRLSRKDDSYPRRKRTFCISSDECVGPRILEK